MDNLASILKIPVLNHDVKHAILRLIQNWSISFEGKPSLSYVGQVYKTLGNEGMFKGDWPPLAQGGIPRRFQVPSSRPDSGKFRNGGHPDSSRVD